MGLRAVGALGPRVEFLPGEASLGEGVVENVDGPLPVGVRGPYVAAPARGDAAHGFCGHRGLRLTAAHVRPAPSAGPRRASRDGAVAERSRTTESSTGGAAQPGSGSRRGTPGPPGAFLPPPPLGQTITMTAMCSHHGLPAGRTRDTRLPGCRGPRAAGMLDGVKGQYRLPRCGGAVHPAGAPGTPPGPGAPAQHGRTGP